MHKFFKCEMSANNFDDCKITISHANWQHLIKIITEYFLLLCISVLKYQHENYVANLCDKIKISIFNPHEKYSSVSPLGMG